MTKSYISPTLIQGIKACLVLFCLGYTTLAFSQQKPEFGLVVKAGTYGLHSKKKDVGFYSRNSSNTTTHNAGSSYTIGIWHALPLGRRLQVSGELLYRSSWLVSKVLYFSEHLDRNNRYAQTQKTFESSLSLPIKFHFTFVKNGKTSVAIGAGLSRAFSINAHARTKSQFNLRSETTNENSTKFSEVEDFESQLSLTAGMYYRLDSKTSIGLEYTFEKPNNPYLVYPESFFVGGIIGNYSVPISRPSMNSFSVSLRHNILD